MEDKKNLKKNQNPLFFFYFSIIIMFSRFGDTFMCALALIINVIHVVNTVMNSIFSKLLGRQYYINLLQQRSQRHRRF
jgi:hypothetical protein